MPKITKPESPNSISTREIPTGSIRRVHFHAERPGDTVSVTFTNTAVAQLNRDPFLFNGPAGIWVLEIKGVSAGATSMQASRSSDKASATLSVAAFTPPGAISLPTGSTDPGVLARLFIAEALSPSKGGYVFADVESSMRWMRRVIATRQQFPKLHMAPANATIPQIIKAPGQFKGFENYPTIASPQQQVIDSCISHANDITHDAQRDYNKHAVAAITSASSSTIEPDPSTNGLSAWRTAGSSAPGGNFKHFRTLGGIDFYEYATPPTA